jgi:hypothetical protein
MAQTLVPEWKGPALAGNGAFVTEPHRRFHDAAGGLRGGLPARMGAMQQVGGSPPSAARNKKRPRERPFFVEPPATSALACLEAGIALADHEHLAAATDDLAVAMALLCGLEGRKHFHGTPREGFADAVNGRL